MTSNPMTNEKVYQTNTIVTDVPMTVTGTINKTLILLGVAVLTACYTWFLAFGGYMDKVQLLMIVGAIAGFILAMITIFKPQQAKVLSVAYAACEGLFLGGISAFFEAAYPGIVTQAVILTFFCMLSMLVLYRAGIIRATEKFRSTLLIAMFAIMAFYLIGFIMSLFGQNAVTSVINSTGPLGIGISVVIVIIAALNFIIDFDFIETGAKSLAPKYFEWYGAFSMMLTLVWLYLEILRLLAKLNSRR